MTDNLVPAVQRIFAMDQPREALVQVAFYGAHAVLALFASVLVGELSYWVGIFVVAADAERGIRWRKKCCEIFAMHS